MAIKLSVVRDCPNVFENASELAQFFSAFPAPFQDDTPELRDALQQMKSFSSPISQAAAALMVARLDKGFCPFMDKPRIVPIQTAPVVEANSPLRMQIQPIKWRTVAGKDDPGKPIALHIRGVLPIGPSADVLWTSKAIYLLKRKSELIFVTEIGECAPCFDGQFIWVSEKPAATTGDPQGILAINPNSGEIRQFSEAMGIPKTPLQWFVSTPLAPGHIIAAGGFGRAWIIDLELNPTTKKAQCHVILEARDQRPLNDPDAWRQKELAFQPSYAATLTAPAIKPATGPVPPTVAQQVLIGRAGLIHPLLIDIQSQKITVVQDQVLVSSRAILRSEHPFAAASVTESGTIYWNTAGGRQQGKFLCQFGYPDLKVTEPNPAPTVPTGQLLLTKTGVIILSQEEHALYTAKTINGPFQKIPGDLPKIHDPLLHPSALHGLVLTDLYDNDSYEIEITAP